jgi:hypothetical protein
MGVGFGGKGSHLNADYHEEKAAGSVDRARRCFVLELGHGIHDPPPGHRPIVSPADMSPSARAALSSSACSP